LKFFFLLWVDWILFVVASSLIYQTSSEDEYCNDWKENFIYFKFFPMEDSTQKYLFHEK